MAHPQKYCRAGLAFLLACMLATHYTHAFANDIFIGKFASETRENFGPGKLGEIELNIVRQGDKYLMSVYHLGKFKYDVEGVPCNPENDGYLQDHPPGEVFALCDTKYKLGLFVYSQNGIKVPVIEKHFKTRFYAYIQWSFWGFRKLQ